MYEQKIEIVDGVRRAFAKFKHFKEMTRRCEFFLKEELPGYTISFSVGQGFKNKHYEINVWGKGLAYNERMYISWYNEDGETWQENFEKAIAYSDFRDSQERHEQEQLLYPELLKLEDDVKHLIHKAKMMVKNLPVPASATVRKDSHAWGNASAELAGRFPILFKSEV